MPAYMISFLATLFNIMRRVPDVIRRVQPHLEGLHRIWSDVIRHCGRRRRPESHKKEDIERQYPKGGHGGDAHYSPGGSPRPFSQTQC